MTVVTEDEPTFTLTTSPITALFGTCAMVTGAERTDAGTLKLYVGPRYQGVYIALSGETADQAERAWQGSVTSHLYITPAPTDDMLFSDETDLLELGRS